MKFLRWTGLLLGLTACAGTPHAPAAPRPQPPPTPVHAATPAPVINSSACRQGCQRQLLTCQGSPTDCDQRYSDCLSHC